MAPICWNTAWNHKLARIEPCFLPVIVAIPALVAAVIVLWQSVSLVVPWRPRWTRSFVVEDYDPIQGEDIGREARRRLSISLFALWTFTGAAFVLELTKAILGWPQASVVFPAITWLLLLSLLLTDRPKTAPFGVLTGYVVAAVCQGLATSSHQPLSETGRGIDLTILILSILAILAVLLMPLRDPNVPAKEVSVPFSEPTSSLRSPEDSMYLWQYMTVSWMSPLISTGSKRQLQDEDVWQLPYEFQHRRLHESFRLLKGTVITRLLQANGIDLVILTMLGLWETVAEYTMPVLFQQLLSSMEDTRAPNRAAITYAALMLIIRLAVAQSSVFSLWFGRRCYERSRGEMITMLYEKTLGRKISFQPSKQHQDINEDAGNGDATAANGSHKTKPNFATRLKNLSTRLLGQKQPIGTKQPASMGKILNLMRNDVYEVAQRFWEVQTLVTKPLSVIFSVALVIRFLGPTALVAISTIVVAQILNAGLARVLVILERRRRKATDDKLQVVSQFIEAIRHLRWYGWQEAWLKQILSARQIELNWRIVTGVCNLLVSLINALGLDLAPAIAFYAYTVIGGKPLTVDVGFPALQLLNMLTTSLREIPSLITVLLNAWVAVERIEDFMAEPDKDKSNTPVLSGDNLALQHASLAWPGTARTVLFDINLSFKVGLTVICGEVAAGKTALLQALLGELDLLDGKLVCPKEPVGYCAQSPWLQSMSIRENILFSAAYEEKRYLAVLDACALTPDLVEFAAGDLSFIGENGIGLSGGQRARVALARAAYSDANILLLDDPLSALDQQTAESIVRKLFAGPLFQERTVVLVTHRTDLVSGMADQVIQLEHGRASKLSQAIMAQGNLQRHTSNTSADGDDQAKRRKTVATAVPVKFIEEEHRAHGGVKASVYWAYIKAGKLSWWLVLFIALAVYRFLGIYLSWFLKDWGEAYKTKAEVHSMLHQYENVFAISSSLTGGLPPPDEDVRPWVLILFLIGVGRSISWTLCDAVMLIIIYTAGKRMFKDIMGRVSHATFRFYDVTPVGRLMNRMTSDIGVIDGGISQQFKNIAAFSLSWISSMAIIAFVTPTFLVFSILLTLLFIVIFRWFLPTSQSLRRLEMVSLTPLMSNFGELLNGLVTVRAFSAQSRFQDRVIRVVDNFQKMDHFYWSLQAWLMYRYDAISAISTFLITVLALVTNLSPGLTAFVLSAATRFVRATHALCQQYGQMQMEFVSVERVVELLNLEQEPEGKVSPPAWWPSFSGDIEFSDVKIKYAPHLDPALSGISFTIKGGSKTAVIGRTGSGKSTLALAMLATVLPEQGQILVDRVDLAEVDKQTLRTRVTFLAQDPVLFPGSMRQNLDPLEEHTDGDCEAVLLRVCERQDWSLDTHIEAGGRNLSQGQRQLVGLARAVLRRSAIIILDEATASIDTETAMQIQQVLHEEMKDSTVITIAHRLEAVRNADYCIVLGKGKVIEQGLAADMLRDQAERLAKDTDEESEE